MILLGESCLRLSAAGKSPTSSELEVLRKLSVAIFDQAIERGILTPPQLIQLGLAWKGTAQFLGQGGVALPFDPEFGMSSAYVMAHRDLHLAKADEAAEFLKAGGATAGEGYGTDLAGDDNVSFLSANLSAREMIAIQSRPNVNAGNS